MNEKLLETNIKALLIEHLIKKCAVDSYGTIVSEFTLDNSSRRADLLTLHKNSIVGYEIKSEADSLNRLQGQVEKYLEYFDKLVIVSATKHISSVLDMTPNNVAVWEISNNKVTVRRRGQLLKNNDKNKLIDLLKSSERLKLVNNLNIEATKRTKKYLGEVLVNCSIPRLRQAVMESIAARYQETNAVFWNQIKNKNVSPTDISLLSKYIEVRAKAKSDKENSLKQWSDWQNKLLKDPEVSDYYHRNKSLIA